MLKQAERGNEASQHRMWDAIEVRLVGTHPLWGHYLCVYSSISKLKQERKQKLNAKGGVCSLDGLR